jgi:hypothetical protein
LLSTLPALMNELSPRRVRLSLPSFAAESLTETMAAASAGAAHGFYHCAGSRDGTLRGSSICRST